jgi:hypothetical protein
MSIWNIETMQEFIIRQAEFNKTVSNLIIPTSEEGQLVIDDIRADLNVLLRFITYRKIKAFFQYDIKQKDKYEGFFYYKQDPFHKYKIIDIHNEYLIVLIAEADPNNKRIDFSFNSKETWMKEKTIQLFNDGIYYFKNDIV